MSTLRTFNLQNPDSGTVNIEMDQGGNTLMTGIATVRGAAHFTSTSGSDAVGIGTDITAYKLDVRVTGAEAGLRVYNPDTSSNASGILRLGNDDNQNAAFLRLNSSNNTSAVGGAGSLVLGHGLSKDLHLSTAGVSRLKITSAGLVGVNCTPLAQFQVKSGTNANISLTTMSSEAAIEAYNDAGSANVPLRLRASTHKFFIGSTEKLRLDSNGYLGLNNAAPHNQYYNNLVIGDGSAAGDKGITIRTQSSNEGVIAFSDADSGAARYAGKIAYNHGTNAMMFFTTNGDERLRITDAGMVGINMTPSTTGNSTYMLQMYNAGSQCFMSLGQGSGNGPLNGLVMGVSNAAHYITGRENSPMIFATNDTERLRISNTGKFGFNTTSPAGQVHIKGNTDESANPSIILDDNGDVRRCYVTNSSGDLMLGGIDSGTVQSRLTIHENGNIYHQRLNSGGSMMYQFATYSSQVSGAASGNTYAEHMAFRQADGLKHGSFVMTIYGDGGDNYMPVLFIKHGYHPTNTSYGGQWFGEMWLNNAGSINPQNYNHTGYNNWATTTFKYRWDCAHWNAKPTMSIIEHHVNYGRTNIADLEISGTQSYFLMWLLPGVYRVTYSAWDGLNAWWTNNSNVGGPLTHREGGGNTTRAVRAYGGRDTRYDSNISWGTQGQT